ncbi:putative radical SAM protein YgiQ [Bacilli bacterium PM5-3]|nr:putative radical SAM protein YgiQ [Bacilli bacterium PM5-3]MDH6603052.1 putative radical SAM protein YgiQ [Bacilli bacterium PM5-9]
MKFLCTNKKELRANNIEQVDFVVVSGDAYVDHPSFGTSLIARYLESFNYTVAIIAQPSVNDKNSIKKCGKPRLAFLVSSGNIDSMVNNYYVSRKKRKKDVYSVNDKIRRPDYATSVYSKMIREAYGDEMAIIIGGIEASLRRFAHYDYWQDKILPSILLTSDADLLVYSMGEKAIIEIADYLNSGLSIKDLTFINGTSYKINTLENISEYKLLPSFNDLKDKDKYIDSFLQQYYNNEHQSAQILIEPYNDCFIVQNIPMPILSQNELDHLYDLPFTYESYDEYHKLGSVNALKEIKYSISINRGCNGACHFCALTFHQGKQISMRSKNSCVDEAHKMMSLPDFKGYIHDVGGPTANFNDEMCDKLNKHGSCRDKSCLGYNMCQNLKVDHSKYFDTLKAVREIEGIKKVFVRSGIRYDYLLKDDKKYLLELAKYHVSGQLRLAPEHCSNNVLRLMNKPNINKYKKFVSEFDKVNKSLGLKQYALPYLMSSHPGSKLEDALELALFLKEINYKPQQAQDFYPTPSTISTLMYYTNKNPFTKKEIYVAKSEEEKKLQNALLQYHLPKNRELVKKALTILNRKDLIPILK